jgi:hypothetical protein
MVQTCRTLKIEIPFMFAENSLAKSLENPSASNLLEAIRFNVKRVGHGHSLLALPIISEDFKEKHLRGVVSNEQ